MMKKAFTLIEILIVVALLGAMATMVLPSLGNVKNISSEVINKSTIQDIKRAILHFKNDVGFVPDNIVLLIYPYEECDVQNKNFDDINTSNTCKNMIAFVDSRLDITTLRLAGVSDYGKAMLRDANLTSEIIRRLDIRQNGWKGSYIGGNGHLLSENIKTLGVTSPAAEANNTYYLSDLDIDLYYDGFGEADTLYTVLGSSNTETLSIARKWFPIEANDFNGTRGSGATIVMDALYDNAKYRDFMSGELTILDPWGTPYEIQFPLSSVTGGKSRERFARIVSFGKNRQRDTHVSVLDIDYSADEYDDSVLYIYENNQTSYFHKED